MIAGPRGTTMEIMELTNIATPAFLIPIVAAIVGLIVKAVRLQVKVDGHAEEINRLREQSAEQKGTLDAHRDNDDIHFNRRLQQEVESRQNDRFLRVEQRLGHIEGKIDLLFTKSQ